MNGEIKPLKRKFLERKREINIANTLWILFFFFFFFFFWHGSAQSVKWPPCSKQLFWQITIRIKEKPLNSHMKLKSTLPDLIYSNIISVGLILYTVCIRLR